MLVYKTDQFQDAKRFQKHNSNLVDMQLCY